MTTTTTAPAIGHTVTKLRLSDCDWFDPSHNYVLCNDELRELYHLSDYRKVIYLCISPIPVPDAIELDIKRWVNTKANMIKVNGVLMGCYVNFCRMLRDQDDGSNLLWVWIEMNKGAQRARPRTT